MARSLAGAVVAVAICAAAAPSHAGAVGATLPSAAPGVQIGVPFSASQPISERHWWRLPQVMRDGDTVQVATQLAGEYFRFCLVPPTDDFSAANTVEEYCSEGANTYYWQPYGTPLQDRETLTYRGPSGQPYLTIYPDPWYEDMSYTVTVERMVTRVNPGLVVPGLIPATFTVTAPLVYGDNAAVGDGVGARLEWRLRAESGKQPSPFTPLVDTYSAGGVATFTGTLPPDARGRAVQLRVCASQPGGDTAICTADQNTVVEQGGPSPACIAASAVRKAHAGAVSRLKGKVRRLTAQRAVLDGKSKRRVTRKLRRTSRTLRTAKRRLAIAKQNARSVC